MGFTVKNNNPFITGYIVNYNEGDKSLQRVKLNYVPSPNDKLHPVTNYDNLSDISFDYYGDSKWWWVIADVNDGAIINPFILIPNTNLIIPDLDKIKSQLP